MKFDLDEEKLLGHPSVRSHLLDVLFLLLLHLSFKAFVFFVIDNFKAGTSFLHSPFL